MVTLTPDLQHSTPDFPVGQAAASTARVAACIYPLPPVSFANFAQEMDVYVRFMRHLRISPHSREDIRILSAIGFVADMTGMGDADVAAILVDMGLRVPRAALPSAYLVMVDQRLARAGDMMSPAVADLILHWGRIASLRVH